ncbi:hypothetical protein BT69DRAFT_1072075 [Atractiella rhizophila]|nr:hypothetical protein BT69DRAFT_1072075 [Atractiella rhizophila]
MDVAVTPRRRKRRAEEGGEEDEDGGRGKEGKRRRWMSEEVFSDVTEPEVGSEEWLDKENLSSPPPPHLQTRREREKEGRKPMLRKKSRLEGVKEDVGEEMGKMIGRLP